MFLKCTYVAIKVINKCLFGIWYQIDEKVGDNNFWVFTRKCIFLIRLMDYKTNNLL